jgi:nucleoside 2-deoxyribosyltransferase
MEKCFVIQPFDSGAFDKRFDDVLAPAIADAGLEAYRVDRDPASTILIEDIGDGIANSAACLCDITSDNPNVWFELGYAIASQKNVVLICSEGRSKFPFDVQHRAIITYRTDSPSDFAGLRAKITLRLKSLIEKHESLGQIAHMAQTTVIQGLDQHEMGTLVAVAQRLDTPDDGVSPHMIRQDMASAGFTPIAATMGLHSLLAKKMLETATLYDDEGNSYTGYRVTSEGMRWLVDNKDKIALRVERKREEIPF